MAAGQEAEGMQRQKEDQGKGRAGGHSDGDSWRMPGGFHVSWDKGLWGGLGLAGEKTGLCQLGASHCGLSVVDFQAQRLYKSPRPKAGRSWAAHLSYL